MEPNLTAVVGGAASLADGLERSGRFRQVLRIDSAGGMRTLAQQGLLTGNKTEIVFLLADNLPAEGQMTVQVMLQRLTGHGWKVVILGATGAAEALVRAYPGAGLLPAPFNVNFALAAITGLGLGPLAPVDEPTAPAPATSGSALPDWGAPADPAPAWGAPAPAATPAPPAAGWPAPTEQPAPAASAWSTPTASPEPSPAGDAWGAAPAASSGWPAPTPESAPAVTPAPPAAAWPQPATDWAAPSAPTPEPAANDWSAPTMPADAGWPAPAAQADTAWPAPAPAAADGWPAPDTAPASAAAWPAPVPAEAASGWGSAPANDWNAPAQAPAASGWGAPESPAAAGWGAPGDGWGGSGISAREGTTFPAAAQRRGRVIVVTAPKGGVGKSGLSLNLAAYLGLRLRDTGRNVCVIDTDFQKADTGKYLGAYSPTVVQIVRDSGAISPDRINNYLVHKPEYNLSVLLGPSTPSEANPMYINGALYSQITDVLRTQFDYIFVDTPVSEIFHDLFQEFALPQADFIVVPVAPNFATIMNADQWLRKITEPIHQGGADVDPAKIGYIINRAEEGIDCPPEAIKQELYSWRPIGMIPESKAWKQASNRHQLVAAMNFADLNTAFAEILYHATGEEILRPGQGSTSTPAQSGLASKLASLFKRTASR